MKMIGQGAYYSATEIQKTDGLKQNEKVNVGTLGRATKRVV